MTKRERVAKAAFGARQAQCFGDHAAPWDESLNTNVRDEWLRVADAALALLG